jgi:hypothetical protein
VGRLTEALEPMRAGLGMYVKHDQWQSSAITASNLSQLELTLGEVGLAVADAEKAVTFAERSGDVFQRINRRTALATALHQAGRRDEAEVRFHEAEEIQAERAPEYPLLNSLAGFQYCDLLLAAAERTALRHMLQSSRIPLCSSLAESCRAVAERVARTLKWAKHGDPPLYSIALDHLTLGCAALYAGILEGLALDQLDPCREFLQHAVDGFRRAGVQEYLLLGLVTRAWLRFLAGAHTGPGSARSDLDEAFESPSAGRCRCSRRTVFCIARGCLD